MKWSVKKESKTPCMTTYIINILKNIKINILYLTNKKILSRVLHFDKTRWAFENTKKNKQKKPQHDDKCSRVFSSVLK